MTGTKQIHRILLVDDETEFAATLAERLNLRGFSAAVETSGERVLERLGEEEFDMLLLDIMLPGMHGIEVLRRIRESGNNVPVVLLTGQAGARDGIEGMKLGAQGYLTKPLELSMLLELCQGNPEEEGGPHA